MAHLPRADKSAVGARTHKRSTTQGRLTPTRLALVAGIVSLGLGCYQLSLPHVLAGVSGWDEGYDEGVYVGAAIRFVHGVVPYRDFVLVHPPGFILIMSPVALLGDLFGSHFTLEAARCITVLVVACNAVLAGLILRPLGRVATITGGLALALWPLTVAVERSVELEPYLVFFCLLGLLFLLDQGQIASRRRVLLAGVALGFAVVVKVWAVLPIVAVLLVCLPKWRTKGLQLISGIAIGGVIPCLFFFLEAPGAFVHDVIVDQISRNASVGGSVPLENRLLLLSGLGRLPVVGHRPGLAVGFFSIFGLVTIVVFALRRRHALPFEWLALVATLIVFFGMFETSASYEWYSYFPAAFTALLFGVTAGDVVWAVHDIAERRRAEHLAPRRAVRSVSLALALCAAGFLVEQEVAYAHAYLLLMSDPSAELASVIPAGACAISDVTTDLLVANRFTPSASNCPSEIDSFGSYLAEDNGHTPYVARAYPIDFEYQWLSALQKANYVVLEVPFSDYFPWTQYTTQWFQQNYRLVAHFSVSYPSLPANIVRLLASESLQGAHSVQYVYENVSNVAG